MARLIEVDHLVKTYRMGEVSFTALQGISLQIDRGEFTAIMGASGSGKSTFMYLLGCLDAPTGGSYRLDGAEISTLDRDQLAEIRNRKIGFVFQNYQLLARSTAAQNVELPLLYSDIPYSNHRKRALAALERVDMRDRANHLPNQLSGGQQQRVAIARAIVNNPQIILADEPTGALDTRTGLEIVAIFQSLNRDLGISIILVTHDPDIARCARRIIQFRDGYVIQDQWTSEPRSAAEELARMPARPAEAVLTRELGVA